MIARASATPARRTSAKQVGLEVVVSADALLALARWMATCRGSPRPGPDDPNLGRDPLGQSAQIGRPDRPLGTAAAATIDEALSHFWCRRSRARAMMPLKKKKVLGWPLHLLPVR